MKRILPCIAVLLLVSCATTYDLPEGERSRSYDATPDVVWDAALESISDAHLALIVAEPENGVIRARSGPTVWDLKGHVVQIVVRDLPNGASRVDANAETVSEDNVVDFGASKRIVHTYLRALDRRMASAGI